MSKDFMLNKIGKEFDYQDYVEQHFSVKYTESDEMRICCPACEDHKFKCYVNNEKKVFNCFICGFSNRYNDVFDFVSNTEGITRAQAQKKLTAEYQATTPDDVESALEDMALEGTRMPSNEFSIKAIAGMPKDAKPLTRDNKQVYGKYWDYLLRRGLTEDEIEAIGMHCVPRARSLIFDSQGKEKGDIGRRVVWPVYGGDHKLVSWQARATRTYDHPKYLNCPEAEQAKTMWPYVRPRGNAVVIVEGMFDAVAVRRLGINAYASFSKKLSKHQYRLLREWGVTEVILFWDKSDAKRDMLKEIEELKIQFQKVYVPYWDDWPSDVDLGDCLRIDNGIDNIQKALDKRVDVTSPEFILWQIT